MNNNYTNARILLVDDEYDISLTFKIVLEESGFIVDSFNDPLLALTNFKAGTYNLLLLDIKMPKMNGFELCKQLKKIDSSVKVCFITAFDIHKGDIKAASTILDNDDDNYDDKHIIQKTNFNE